MEYHVPHISMVNNIEGMEQLLDFFSKSERNGISNLHYEEDLTKACNEPLIENMVRDLPHVSMICNVDELKYS